MLRRFAAVGLVAGVAALWLTGCAGLVYYDPPPPPPFIPPPVGARVTPVKLGKLSSALRHGAVIGQYQFGLTCRSPFSAITWSPSRTTTLGHSVKELFFTTLRDAGYDVGGDPNRLFDEEEEETRGELVLSARITDLELNLCRESSLLWGESVGANGEATIGVEWSVYSQLDRRQVYLVNTTGRAATTHSRFEAEDIFIEDAFADALARLGVDPGFRELVFATAEPPRFNALRGPERRGLTPEQQDAADARAREPLTLPRQADANLAMAHDAEEVVKATVLITTGAGHGSGAIIAPTADGGCWILTNDHVIGNAERVRVVTADGKTRIGVVERRHRPRDVALIRLDHPPPAILAIRETPVRIGEDVYAIGAPIRERLRGTVTRGVVSALREAALTQFPEIQTDAAIYPGSSGGPLVDAQGRLIALSRALYLDQHGVATSLTFFIPITDALTRLNLSLGSAGGSAGLE